MGKNGDGKLPELGVSTTDHISSVVKAVAGAAPFIGSLLSEVAGIIIPNQRLDRLAKFAGKLEDKLSKLDQEFVRSKLTDENFTDLLEEGVRQAARSLSQDRREYIASIIATGLTAEDVEFMESKHLLRILGEVNDVEVIILRFYLVPSIAGDEEFREKHKDILHPEPVHVGASQSVADKSTLHHSYCEHLVSLGLLKRRYRTDMQTKQPEFDTFTGGLKTSGYVIEAWGRLLLRHIGLATQPGSRDYGP